MVTSTCLPFSRLVTTASVPSGSEGWAAVSLFWSNFSPLAVFFPWCHGPYHDATPTSSYPGSGGVKEAIGSTGGVCGGFGAHETSASAATAQTPVFLSRRRASSIEQPRPVVASSLLKTEQRVKTGVPEMSLLR